jgi:diguanylate cyclase (GGDEF)-like protein
MSSALALRREQLERLATHDGLTGLANQRAFGERLQDELARAAREYQRVAVVALDLDHFKTINDSFGHAVGDEGLRILGSSITAYLRAGDLCGRVGGDEFVLALGRADAGAALLVVERIRERLAGIEFGPGRQRLTLSAGVAEYPRHATDKAELMRMADRALYQSKRDGRDRSTVHAVEDPLAARTRSAERDRREAVVRSAKALVQAVDARDGYTYDHSQRVAEYAATLATHAGLDSGRVALVRSAGVLHDVGRIGVETATLNKIGLLSEPEREAVRRHSALGRDLIAASGMGAIATWVLHLHERWDGFGQPDGLRGEDIPLESRILHLAESFDAMTSPPNLRDPKPVRDALRGLEMGAGIEFDPTLARAMAELVQAGEIEVGRAARDAFRSLSPARADSGPAPAGALSRRR